MKQHIENQIEAIDRKLEIYIDEARKQYLVGKKEAYNDILSMIIKSEKQAEKQAEKPY